MAKGRTDDMPRGVKGSGLPKMKKAQRKKDNETQVTAAVTTSTERFHKPYPTYEERLAAVNARISNLTKLKEERTALIAKTEAKLQERRDALSRAEVELDKAQTKKEKIIDAMNKPAKDSRPKLSKEERAEVHKAALVKARETRAAMAAKRKAEKAKLDELVKRLAEQGKSVDDLLAGINGSEK